MASSKMQKLIRALRDHSYDSGYYSGKLEDGEPLHIAAVDRRALTQGRLTRAITKLETDAELGKLLRQIPQRWHIWRDSQDTWRVEDERYRTMGADKDPKTALGLAVREVR